MKKIITIAFAMFLTFGIFAQDNVLNISKSTFEKVNNNSKGTAYGQDSSFYYGSYSTDWEPSTKTVTTEFNDQFQVATEEYYQYNTGDWDPQYKMTYTYDANIPPVIIEGKNIDAVAYFPWNSNFLNWTADTIFYYNATPYYSKILRQQIFEEKVIQLSWDQATNQITGGSRVNIDLLHDSLYSKILIKNWDNATQEYEFNINRTFTYDANDNLQTQLNETWNSTSSEWENDEQYFFVISDGNLIQRIKQTWNGTAWDNSDKDTYTFDANGNKTNETDFDWVSSDWQENTKYDYSYDANNNLISNTYSTWNSTTSQWLNSSRSLLEYDVNNNKTSYTYQNWNSTTSSWVNNSKTTYSYNANNDMTETIYLSWNSTTSEWEPYEKETYTYNTNNDLIEYKDFDYVSSIWENNMKDTYTYDSNFNLTETISQYWDNIGSEWVNVDRTTYFYSEHNVNLNFVDNGLNALFPNPTNGLINIQNDNKRISSVSVIDANGKTVYSNNNINRTETSVDLTQYGQGIYIINVTSENGETSSQKVIVK